MKSAFYFFIIAQILNIQGLYAEKVIKYSPEFNSIKGDEIKKNKDKHLKKIFGNIYKEDESYFENENEDGSQSVMGEASLIEVTIKRGLSPFSLTSAL